MKNIYLLRHGRTDANDRHLYCGATDLPLSPGGREALEELRGKGGYPSIDRCRVVTSGMRRTEETLSALFGAMTKALHFGDIDWEDVIRETVPAKFLDLNLAAFRAGRDAVQ